jgi:enolase
MSIIEFVQAREVLDSRGNPTVEAEVILTDGSVGSAIVPSGASTGKHEALELRDKDKERYLGRGVLKAVRNVNEKIAAELTGMLALDQTSIDRMMRELDGTEHKKNLGANAILAVSMATARAAAECVGLPLYLYLGGCCAATTPVPMMNILNGGSHADNNVDIQEFMIAPTGASCIAEAIRMGAEVYHSLKNVLKKEGMSTGVGDEGGYAPDLKSNRDALEMIRRAVEEAGYTMGEDLHVCLDPASSEFYGRKKKGKYFLAADDELLDSKGMVQYWEGLVKDFPEIISIEDGMAEDDWKGWEIMAKALGSRIQLVGDDIFVTNPERLARGLESACANSILIKLNQIGTVSETIEVVRMAQRAGWTCVVSHRSGETEDTFISHLAVGMESGQIKTGSLARTDRIAKYNELIRIAEDLENNEVYPGVGAFYTGT